MTDDSEHSQSDTITYDDPAGRMEREKIMAQLKRGNSPSPDFHTEDEEEDRRDRKTDTVGVTWDNWERLNQQRAAVNFDLLKFRWNGQMDIFQSQNLVPV